MRTLSGKIYYTHCGRLLSSDKIFLEKSSPFGKFGNEYFDLKIISLKKDITKLRTDKDNCINKIIRKEEFNLTDNQLYEIKKDFKLISNELIEKTNLLDELLTLNKETYYKTILAKYTDSSNTHPFIFEKNIVESEFKLNLVNNTFYEGEIEVYDELYLDIPIGLDNLDLFITKVASFSTGDILSNLTCLLIAVAYYKLVS